MAGMGNARHLAAGSTRPTAPSKDILRVYGMKFCPYVHRLKLVLAKKGIKHETVNINLANRPSWYYDINPRGKVPSIERNGVILYESDIVSNYIDGIFKENKLSTEDPLKHAQEQIILGYFSDVVSGYYSLLKAGDDKKAEAMKKIKENLSRVVAYLSDNNKSYLCGDKLGMTDYMVWPHLERMSIVIPEFFKEYPVLKDYADKMEKDDAVIACRHSNELHLQFIQSYRDGKTKYDIGTVEDN